MRQSFLLIPAFIVISAALIANPAICEVIDKVAIIVNDEIITDREVSRQLSPIYEKYKTMYSGSQLVEKLEEARQKIAEQMIDDRLLYSEAKKENIEVSEKDIEARVDDVARNIGSKENFEKALLEQQLTIRDVRDKYRQQLMIKKLVDKKIGPGITITPSEIEAYYKNNMDQFTQPERVKLKNILISIKKFPDPGKAYILANDIVKRLKEGCDFDGLAKVYSDGPGAARGGAMGYVKKGDLLPEIEKVIFNLKPDETSGVVQSSLGYHIFKVEEKEPAKTLPLSEAKRYVEDAVYRTKVDSKMKGWIGELKKNAYIAFK